MGKITLSLDFDENAWPVNKGELQKKMMAIPYDVTPDQRVIYFRGSDHGDIIQARQQENNSWRFENGTGLLHGLDAGIPDLALDQVLEHGKQQVALHIMRTEAVYLALEEFQRQLPGGSFSEIAVTDSDERPMGDMGNLLFEN